MIISPDQMVDYVIATLKDDTLLAGWVKKWETTNGLVPSVLPTISAGLGDVRYDEYNRDTDEATATIKINIYCQHSNLAKAEKTAQLLAAQTRFVLSERATLGGELASGFVKSIGSLYPNEATELAVVTLTFCGTYFAPRRAAIEGIFTIKRGSGDSDVLPIPALSILSVPGYPPTAYRHETDGNTIKWGATLQPTSGADYPIRLSYNSLVERLQLELAEEANRLLP